MRVMPFFYNVRLKYFIKRERVCVLCWSWCGFRWLNLRSRRLSNTLDFIVPWLVCFLGKRTEKRFGFIVAWRLARVSLARWCSCYSIIRFILGLEAVWWHLVLFDFAVFFVEKGLERWRVFLSVLERRGSFFALFVPYSLLSLVWLLYVFLFCDLLFEFRYFTI